MREPTWLPATVTPGDFEWDPDLQFEILGEQDDDFAATLAPMSGRAQVAFSLGCAEWIRRAWPEALADTHFDAFLRSRWLLLAGDDQVNDMLDARMWDEETVPGSVADSVIAMVINTYFGNGAGKWDCALASMHVTWVLADPTPFEQWQAAVIPQLCRLHPPGGDWFDQTPVYLDELDPNGPDPSQRDAVLAALREGSNPFLFSD